jgi:hypothetical protein
MESTPTGGGTAVPVETIDALSLDRLDLLKVDVEGMEVEVLAGAGATIRRLQPLLYLENDREGASSTALIASLEAFGYRAWWHFPPLFNPDNFFANATNVFPRVISINLLCAPAARPLTVRGAVAVTGCDDTWQAARQRMRDGGAT